MNALNYEMTNNSDILNKRPLMEPWVYGYKSYEQMYRKSIIDFRTLGHNTILRFTGGIQWPRSIILSGKYNNQKTLGGRVGFLFEMIGKQLKLKTVFEIENTIANINESSPIWPFVQEFVLREYPVDYINPENRFFYRNKSTDAM